MSHFPIPVDEVDRLKDLASYQVLDTEREPSFDRLTKLARRILQTPIALISLVDQSRQWFKSCIGLDVRETPRQLAFCTYTILSNKPLIVPDATKDYRFASNLLVTGPPHICFYIGAPLISSNGFRLGSLCAIDTKPREYPSEHEILCLQDLAAEVVEQLEKLRTTHELLAANKSLQEREQEMEEQRQEAFHLKNQMSLALEAGEMGTWEWDGSSNFIDRSPVTSRLLGFPNPSYSVSRDYWINQIHPDDRAEVMQKSQACQKSGIEFRAEYRIILPDGAIRWLSGRACQRVKQATESVGLIGVCWDVTDRKIAERTLSESQEIERGWGAVSPLGMFRANACGLLVNINPRCHEIFRVPRERLLTDWKSLVHPEDRAPLLEAWGRATQEPSELDYEYRAVLDDGRVLWIHVRAMPLKNAQEVLIGFIGSIDDITTRKEAQNELIGVQRLLQIAVDTIPQSVFWKDVEGRFQGCNQSFALDNCLSSPSDVIGKTDFELPQSQFAAHYRAIDCEIMSSGVPKLNFEVNFFNPEGSLHLGRISKRPLRNSSGKIIGILGTYEDITEQRQKEEELLNAKEAAEAAALAKGQFLANMSHEIRTPLNGVLGMIALLLDSQLGDEQRKWAETARVSGEALLRLLNNVLDLSKAEAGKLSIESLPFNLLGTVEQCAGLFEAEARSKGLILNVNFAAQTPDHVVGDSTRIRQILINLIANAVKFTSHGEITVNVETKALSLSEMLLCLDVQDTGVGVPREAELRLFKPFSQADGSTTRRFGGTGLGLSIAKQLAELMMGCIGYRPRPEGGSTFWMEVPVGRVKELALEVAAASPGNLSFEKQNILVVEDNPINQVVTSRFLAKLGCHIDIASNGREAIRLWRECAYDLILMDGQMPELDGYETTKELRRLEPALKRKRVPIVALTAHALPGDKERCLAAGMDDYLSKPVQQELLRETAAAWLRHKPEPEKES